MDERQDHDRFERRLRRQLDAITCNSPRLRKLVEGLMLGPAPYLRIPIGLLLVAFGFIGFLPVLGFWMIPLGLVLLAIDIPALRPAISGALVRIRRRLRRARGTDGSLAWLDRWLGHDR